MGYGHVETHLELHSEPASLLLQSNMRAPTTLPTYLPLGEQIPYVDVCDDARLATAAKELSGRAQEEGVPATISAGIWPGIDQLMAVEVLTGFGIWHQGSVNIWSVSMSVVFHPLNIACYTPFCRCPPLPCLNQHHRSMAVCGKFYIDYPVVILWVLEYHKH